MGKAKRLIPLLAAVSLAAGVIILVVGALWMAGSASGERDRFSSLEIAPHDADVFVAINTDPTSPQWLGVIDSLDSIQAKGPVRRAIDEALADVNLDWEEDILPIAGDEGFFSIPDLSKVDGERGYTAAFRVRDTGRAEEVFDGLRERAVEEGQEIETEVYEGITIHNVVTPDLDGDPSTQSDCEVDENGTILCDGQAPIPEDPFWKCAEIGYDLSLEGRSTAEAPAECQPFFECPSYWASEDAEVNTEDADGDGTSDACEEADRIKREWEIGIQFAAPHQDCADLADVSDDQCRDVTKLAGDGAVALFGDVLAVGASADDVKAVVDVVQARAPSAAENERLQEFRQGQEEDFLMWGYADLAPVWDMAEDSIPTDFDTSGGPGETDITLAPAPAVPEGGFRVTSFDSEYTIDANGTLLVKEIIAVDFGTVEKHGIFREIPTRISYDSANDETLKVDNFLISRDGVPESMQGELIGDNYEVKIGDPNVTITGPHTYEFQYTIVGGIRQSRWGGPDAYYELRWVATGDRWPVGIEKATVTVNTPHGTIDTASCHAGVGEFGEQDFIPCQASFDDRTVRFVPDGPIEPGAGLHFSVGVNGESGAPKPVLVPAEESSSEGSPVPTGEDEFPFALGSKEIFDELRGTYDRVGFSISSTGDGFALDVRVLHEPGFVPKFAVSPTRVFDSHFADSVPAETMFFFAGYDLYGQNWAPLRDYLDDAKLPDGSTLDDFIQTFADETGLNLEDDILALLTGEYAIAGDVSDLDQDAPQFSILAMLDVADAGRAQQSLDRLGDYLEGEDVVAIDKDERIQQWTIQGSAATEVVGITVSGDSLIAGYPDSVAEDAADGLNESLGETNDWKRTMGLLPTDTTSVGFVSVSRILEEVRKMDTAERSFEEATNGELTLEDLTPVRSVGYATTAIEGGYGARFVVLITD